MHSCLSLTFFILISVLWTSKKYVAPILKGLEQIKTNTDLAQEESPVLEIEDLFAFLAKQDQDHAAALSALNQERLEAQSKQQQLQGKLEQVSNDLGSAQEGIARLAYSRQQEIDPDDFQYFLERNSSAHPNRAKGL